ncbi:MAG: hypothetical protein JNL19_05855 [Burkholderiales bacterium]|nr:hypothetical protein [Burkholderiales bacterium]
MNPYKQAEMQSESANYRWAPLAEGVLAALAAGLLGWAAALALGLWGDRLAAKLSPWQPFALMMPALDGVSNTAVSVPGTMKLVGVAGDRAYFLATSGSGSRVIALREGERTPAGDLLHRIERDGVVMVTGSGESHWPVLPARPAQRSAGANGTVAGVASGALAANCRLSASDKAAAVFIDPAVVTALAAERATFARIFEPTGAGVRARGTGGTTAMFSIVDGDVLSRADGTPLRSSDGIVSEVLGRLARGASVVVEGERKGAPRRWVFAPKGCA